MANKSACPSGRAWKVSHCPSGDQLATPINGPPNAVSRTGLLPSAFATQISGEPERDEVKAILCPSGENFGF
jgi:hypothetical protein